MKHNEQKYTKKQPIALAVLLLGFLAGCGGGSGGSSDSGAGDGPDPSGPVVAPKLSLLAGIPSAIGNQDGDKENAYYDSSYGVGGLAIDNNGEIIFSDAENNTIRKIAKDGGISTFAGAGFTAIEVSSANKKSNHADGKGILSRFYKPKNIVIDGSGDIYINDSENKAIRKIDASGSVTTLAGKVGYCDETKKENPDYFCDVNNIVVDYYGNVYTSEGNFNNNPIKKITPDGNVITLVEKASVNSTFQPSLSISPIYKHLPVQLAVDAQGTIYAADPNDRVIRKYINGELALFSGTENKENSGYMDGSASEAKFSANIKSAIFDKKNNFYILDDKKIRKINADGSVITALDLSSACSIPYGQTKVEQSCQFDNLIINDSGQFIVQEKGLQPGYASIATSYSLVRQLSVNGTSTVVAGKAPTASLVDGNAEAARFSKPGALTVASSGTVYMADSGNGVLRSISEMGQTSTLGNPEKECGLYDVVTAGKVIKIQDLGRCYFNQLATDKNNSVYAASGGHLFKISTNGDVSLFLDLTKNYSRDGNVFSLGVGGVVMAEDGTIYASYATNDFPNVKIAAIFKITASGESSLFAGSMTAVGHRDGIGANALFKDPKALTLDSKGNLYVLDDKIYSPNTVYGPTLRKITPSGQVTTLAGQANREAGLVDGNAAQSVFTFSFNKLNEGGTLSADLAVDSNDNIYITDPEHSVIRKVTPAGKVSTLAGTSRINGFMGGDLPGVINRPTGIAVHKDTLYFSMRNAVGKINLN